MPRSDRRQTTTAAPDDALGNGGRGSRGEQAWKLFYVGTTCLTSLVMFFFGVFRMHIKLGDR
eukprot:scaffold129_cov254-Pinguiococcus_pyrenoidosus.AAC.2